MIKVYSEINLSDFHAWSGGKDTKNELSYEELERLDDCISELYPDGLSETELNDILWFDNEFIAQSLGFEDWDALIRNHNGEEDDDDED